MTWQLHEGDCLDPVSGLASLPDRSVDHVITDPPYEAETHSRGRRIMNPRTKVIRESPISFSQMDERTRDACGTHFARLARRWVLVFSQIEGVPAWRAAMESGGLRYMRTMVWVKPNAQPQLTGDRPGVGYECIVVAHTKDASHWNGGGARGWFEHAVDANFSRTPREHETQKPIAVMERLVRNFTDPGETILDPFAGSGTTGVAAITAGRSFIGWEKDAKYAEVARRRLGETREQAVLPLARAPKHKQAGFGW